jgi:hypothetical protein
MEKHTPGPWGAEHHPYQLTKTIRASNGDGDIVAQLVRARDAHLIAAAPDLLAACKALIAVSTNTQAEADWSREWCAALDAIAKAEGR